MDQRKTPYLDTFQAVYKIVTPFKLKKLGQAYLSCKFLQT